MKGRSAAAALAVLAVALTVGCGTQVVLKPDTVTGEGGSEIIVFVDEDVAEPVRAALPPLLHGRPGRVASGAGSPAEIATTVKNGYRADALVLPEGPELERVRDELVVPPVRIGRRGNTTYWAAPVTADGVVVADYLAGPVAAATLAPYGFELPAG